MEPKENLLADAMFEIMQRNMPENGEIYWKMDVRWGAIWQEMRVKADDLLAIPLPTLENFQQEMIHYSTAQQHERKGKQ